MSPLIHLALHRGWITVGTPTYKPDRRAYNRAWMRRYRATRPKPKLRARKTTVRRGDYARTDDGQRAS